MSFESNKNLLSKIKSDSLIFERKYFKEDEKFLLSAEIDLIKHLKRITSLLSEIHNIRKSIHSLSEIKKLTPKDLKEKRSLLQELNFLENDEAFLNEDRENMTSMLFEASKLVWDEYRYFKKIDYSFEEILDNEKNLKFYMNEGIINTFIIRFVPRILADRIKKVFPANPKDEFSETRLLKRHFIIHEGPTNSGKTHFSIERLLSAKSGLYLAPLRLLALEISDRSNLKGIPCNLKTGEEEIIVDGALHTSSTVEKIDLTMQYDVIVIDEAQLISDPQRGAAWTRAILGARSEEIHICCALNATEIILSLIKDCNDSYEIISHSRDTALIVEDDNFIFPDSLKEGDALIAFSRRSVLEIANKLEYSGVLCSIIYGNLPPETRRMQFDKFMNSKTHILVSTDAIGMGVNLPIKRVVFLENQKFDGVRMRPLLSSEIKQIAGRAGRKGIYETGYVNTLFKNEKPQIDEMLISKEHTINHAFLAPTGDILQIGDAELDIKLKVWSEITPEVDFYTKINVDRLVSLIHIITEMKIKKLLTEKEVFKAINIPFDEEEFELLKLWKEYLAFYAKNKSSVLKPEYVEFDLLGLETYYKKINLYYTFSKTFRLHFDDEWIKEERRNVAKLIDEHLLGK